MKLKRVKKWASILVVAMTASVSGYYASLYAQDADPKPDAAAVAPAEPAPVAEGAPPAAPALPAYFTGTNDPKAPSWPDPTGGKAGTWVTPSDGPIGDGNPAAMTVDKLYDRIVHNMYSINMVWVMVAGFLVM
ncbi:MAG: hypothetical protein WCH39_11770, partial [Schlesneria sp.]